jgi:chemotaxis protein histidine kinase CheA
MDPLASERELAMQVFAAETQEVFATMDRELTALEARPGDGEMLHNLFRSVRLIECSAREAGFDAALGMALDLVALIERLGALAAPPDREHIGLIQRTLVALVESTADAIAGVSTLRPEVPALRDEIRRAPSGAGYGSIRDALRFGVDGRGREDGGKAPPEPS